MAIKRIRVSNFKSFKDLDIELGMLNVVIGANAVGKSNFTQIFKFLRDIEANNLSDAIFMHGGMESLTNLKIGRRTDLTLKITSDKKMGWGRESKVIKINETIYECALRFNEVDRIVRASTDELTQKIEIANVKEEQEKLFEDEVVARGKFTICNIEGKPQVFYDPPDLKEQLENENFMLPFSFLPKMFGKDARKDMLLIQTPYSAIPPWETLFGDIGIYDIDPHIARRPFQIAGRAELQENGDNLTLVLRQILEDNDKNRKFHNLIRNLLPFVVEIGTEKFPEKSMLITLREDYYFNNLLAHLLSDGTINIAALITALYFEDKSTIIVEEPERNMHPSLISKVVDMMKDASMNKQIIITTHSPEVVKHAGLENIFLISRDQDGFSTISKPSEKEEVKIFLENELGLDELYVQNLLAV